jgi:spore coat polysaccharide biosynthesis protein SpsF (cytidylyltransferase family)
MIAAIIQARMGSTRLPGKVLMPVLGKPMLQWMLERISLSEEVDRIIIATTINECDDKIEEFALSVGCQVYRGSEEDVLDRYYQAAKSLPSNPSAIIRLTGDCPLLDPKILDSMIINYKKSNVDFLSNSEPLPSSWPDGMDISIVSFKALHKAWSGAIKPSEREHVTFYFWNNSKMFRCKRVEHTPDLSKYRLTLDYLEDFYIIKNIIEFFEEGDGKVKSVSMSDIIKYIDEHLEIFEINSMHARGVGWKASFKRDEDQINKQI